jgi:hypothetical protein
VRDLVWKPAFSFATAGTAVAIVMLYIVQQVSLLRDVDALERKMKQAAGNPATVEVTYALRSDAARQNSDLRQLEERALPHLVVRANGLVTIRRSTLERYAGGERSGLADTFRLCAMFGGDAQRMASLARYLQHHLTTTLLYSPGG